MAHSPQVLILISMSCSAPQNFSVPTLIPGCSISLTTSIQRLTRKSHPFSALILCSLSAYLPGPKLTSNNKTKRTYTSTTSRFLLIPCGGTLVGPSFIARRRRPKKNGIVEVRSCWICGALVLCAANWKVLGRRGIAAENLGLGSGQE